VTVVLTLAQTTQLIINIYKRNNTKNTVQTIQKTLNTNTHITKTPAHYKPHIYTNPHITKQVKQKQYKIYPNEIATIQSCTLHIRSPNCTWHFYPQKLKYNTIINFRLLFFVVRDCLIILLCSASM
jgi:hypothetical protein